MSTNRTNCHDCGFDVVARSECPLCGQVLSEPASVTGAVRGLFVD